ncbi:MAG: TetR family transcriptional regulator [Rhodobacterales bacterium]|nr:TetR family transcriptional regulator [Rhodobacterales bacterium]
MSIERLATEIATFPKGRVPGALRREHILALALPLFIERGFGGTSMDELARRAAVSKPVIYDSVGSKLELFESVMTTVGLRLYDCVAQAVVDEPCEDQRLYVGVLAFLTFVHANQGAWNALLTAESSLANTLLDAVRKRQAQMVGGLLFAGAEQAGHPVSIQSAELLAYTLNGSAEAGAIWWRDNPHVPAPTLARIITGAFNTDWSALSAGVSGLTTTPS